MNDAEHDLLVLEAQDGSRAAFGRLARHHHPGLLRYALSLARDPGLAQDAVQDGWLTVVRKLRRLDDPRAFRGWLYHAVRWRVLDRLNARSRRGEEPLPEPAGQPAVDDDARRDRRLDLDAGLARLHPGEREVLQLFYLRGLRVADIAVALDVPAGTVKSRLYRARQQLKTILEGDET
jgi:RNA polymerase sigma-70 factor (ECF subfamily)